MWELHSYPYLPILSLIILSTYISFSVPNLTDVVMGSAYAGCVLRQVASQALNRNSQDVIFMPRQLSSLNVINRLISGEFSIPKIAGLSALDKFNMSLTFLGPWSPQVPIITVVSPHGIKYGSRQGENVIAQKWSQNVSTLNLDIANLDIVNFAI